MKKLFLFIVTIFLFWGCVVDPPPEPTPEPLPFVVGESVNGGLVTLGIIKPDALSFFSQQSGEIWEVMSGEIKAAGKYKYSVSRTEGNFLIEFDNIGKVVDHTTLNTKPQAITVKESASKDITSLDEVWLLERVSPQAAEALGGQPVEHTKVWKNGILQDPWNKNKWKAKKIFVASDTVIAQNDNDSWHDIDGDKQIINAYDGGIIICNVVPEDRTGDIVDITGTYPETWNLNFFIGGKWQLADGVWYSHNGYTWTAIAGLIENANSLWGWNIGDYPITGVPNGEIPLPLPAGIRTESGEVVTYWLECNSGWLIRHVPSVDRIDIERRLFDGDFLRETGARISKTLNPIIAGDHLYYDYNDEILDYDFELGTISVFSGGVDISAW